MIKNKKLLFNIFQWLVNPVKPIVNPALLYRVKFLSAILLTFIAGSCLYTLLLLLTTAAITVTFYWINATTVIFFIGYFLNRRGYYKWGVVLSIGFLSISILMTTLMGPGNVDYLFVTIMPVVIGSMLFSMRGTLLLAGLNLAGMVVMVALNPRITFTAVSAAMGFFITLSAFLLFFIHHRNQLEVHRQEELAKKEAQYRSLVENINEVIFFINKEGNFTFISPVIEKMTGYKIEEILEQPFSFFIFPDDLPALQASFARMIAGAAEANEFRILAKDKQMLHVRTFAQPLVENHRTVGIIGVLTDFSGQKRLQDQLQQAQKMESVGRLAGGIAHDFNNILTVIIGYCEMLLDDEKANPGSSSMVKSVKTAAERAASLTQQLLAFSRKQIIQPQILNINDLIKNLEKMLRRLIGEHIALEVHLQENVHLVKVDPAQLEQVIMNLAVNARDAMPGGGELAIETNNAHLDQNYCYKYSEVVPGHYAMLVIRDTGHGIDEKTKKNIFEPFFTTKDPGKGTGLGLSTVYGIIKQSGGHIWFTSEIDKGTTFKIYLPTVPDKEAAQYKAKKQQKKPPKTKGQESLLVVEDQEDLREMILESLKLYGYNVTAAQNGTEALEICQNQAGKDESFDLLITDVVMPEMNGKELADHIAQKYPGIKTLYISGYTEEAIVDQNILLEGLSFLPKPFSPSALVHKVRNILDTNLNPPLDF